MKGRLILFILSISMFIARSVKHVTLLKHNEPIQKTLTEESIHYFTIPTEKDSNDVPKEIQIKSNLISSNEENELVPIIVASYKPLPNSDKDSQLLLGGIGDEVKIDSDFLNKAGESKIYIGVFGQDCTYEIKATILNTSTNVLLASPTPASTAKPIKTSKPTSKPTPASKPRPGPTARNTPIRSLAEEGGANANDTEKERLDFYRADGVSALMVAFILIFVSIIACVIMMNTYVHTTALVEKPLKLGRVEA